MVEGSLFRRIGGAIGLFKSPQASPEISYALSQAKTAFLAGDFDSAEELIQRVFQMAPENSNALNLGGAIASERKDYSTAAARFADAIKFAPRDSGVRSDYGNLLLMIGSLQEAEIEFRLAIKFDSENVSALRGLAHLLLVAKRYEEAYSLTKQLVAKDPDNPRSVFAHGFATQGCFNYAEAYQILTEAGVVGESDSLFYAAFGSCAYNLQRPQEAESILRAGLEKFPQNCNLQFQLAMTLLSLGQWRDGFALYESRYTVLEGKKPTNSGRRWRQMRDRLVDNLPQVRPGVFDGERILILSEQGFGDLIMMLRFVPELLERGAKRVAVVCPVAVFPLQEAINDSRVEFILARDSLKLETQEFSCHCFDMSLPYLLSIDSEPFPGCAHFLFPPKEKVEFWKAWLKSFTFSEGVLVGLAWAGNPELDLDSLRSFPLKLLAPLFDIDHVLFVNLQKDHATREEIEISGYRMVDPMNEVADFLDTAAIMCNLDIIITVDTVIAHLAGALGRKVWLLNRFESEWRWQFHRDDSPWYPTMRIFNQDESKNWRGVLEKVAEELRFLANGKITS